MIANRFYAGDLPANTYVVNAQDHDRVTAERDALQERLNAADQKDDDLQFQLKDREGSRRDWFEAAQAAEKRVVDLEGLLRDWLGLFPKQGVTGGPVTTQKERTLAALSASAEPSDYLKSCEAAHRALSLKPSASVERDERAEFETHPRFKGMDFTRAPFHSDYYDSSYTNGCWDGWTARAALDSKATEGASHE